MNWPFCLIAGLTVGSAIAAMSLPNLVHCALSLVVTFAGLAALFLQLNAEFVGFVQVLVYIGAVAILIVFAILLTRGTEPPPATPPSAAVWWGPLIAAASFLVMAGAVTTSAIGKRGELPAPSVPVKLIGQRLMQEYVLPLEVLGLLLTAALIGAVVLAMAEKRR